MIKKVLISIFLIMLALNAFAFVEKIPFTVTSNSLQVSVSSNEGGLLVKVLPVNGSEIEARLILMTSSKDVVLERVIKSKSFSETLFLKDGDYLLVFNNSKTGFQNPKISFSFNSVPKTSSIDKIEKTPVPLATLVSSNLPTTLLIVFVAFIAVIFLIGRGKGPSSGDMPRRTKVRVSLHKEVLKNELKKSKEGGVVQ